MKKYRFIRDLSKSKEENNVLEAKMQMEKSVKRAIRSLNALRRDKTRHFPYKKIKIKY